MNFDFSPYIYNVDDSARIHGIQLCILNDIIVIWIFLEITTSTFLLLHSEELKQRAD